MHGSCGSSIWVIMSVADLIVPVLETNQTSDSLRTNDTNNMMLTYDTSILSLACTFIYTSVCVCVCVCARARVGRGGGSENR